MVEGHSFEAYLALYRASRALERQAGRSVMEPEAPYARQMWELRPRVDRDYIKTLQVAFIEKLGADPEKILADDAGGLDTPDSGVVAW